MGSQQNAPATQPPTTFSLIRPTLAPPHLLCLHVAACPALIVLGESSQQAGDGRCVGGLRLQPAGGAHCVLRGGTKVAVNW